MNKAIWASVTVLTLVFLAGTSLAVPVTIQIEGVVDDIIDSGDNFSGAIEPCDVITGYYTYDSAAPDLTQSDPYKGTYVQYGASYGIFLETEGFAFEAEPEPIAFKLVVDNGTGEPGHTDDMYYIQAESNNAPVDGEYVCRLSWHLEDYSGNAISSKALPLTEPYLPSWTDVNYMTIEGGIYDEESGRLQDKYSIQAHITTATLIPEPAVVLFMGLGALNLFRRKC